MIVGWNLLPQPRWIERIYIRAAQRIGNWLAGLCVLLIVLPGCTAGTLIPIDIGYAKQRAMAEIAIASATATATPSPDRTPRVGDKCPDCNDPPGACGVGRTGDGNVCDTCLLCNGDGRIDDRDVTQSDSDATDRTGTRSDSECGSGCDRSDDCQCIDCDCDPCRCDKELTLKNFAPLAVDDRNNFELESNLPTDASFSHR